MSGSPTVFTQAVPRNSWVKRATEKVQRTLTLRLLSGVHAAKESYAALRQAHCSKVEGRRSMFGQPVSRDDFVDELGTNRRMGGAIG